MDCRGTALTCPPRVTTMHQIQNRRSVRLSAYDYRTPGAYFVTIVAHERLCIFGRVIGDTACPEPLDEIIAAEWQRAAAVRPDVELGEFVVMPNHLHGIIWLPDTRDAVNRTGAFQKPVAGSLSTIVGLYKSEVTKTAKNRLGIERVWQRGFYEHVIRTEKALARIRQYIVDNPAMLGGR